MEITLETEQELIAAIEQFILTKEVVVSTRTVRNKISIKVIRDIDTLVKYYTRRK
jgi:hypothetical protein